MVFFLNVKGVGCIFLHENKIKKDPGKQVFKESLSRTMKMVVILFVCLFKDARDHTLGFSHFR